MYLLPISSSSRVLRSFPCNVVRAIHTSMKGLKYSTNTTNVYILVTEDKDKR